MPSVMSLIPPHWTPEPWGAQAVSLILLVWFASEVLYRLEGRIRSREDGKSSEAIGVAMGFNLIAIPLLATFRVGRVEGYATELMTAGILLAALGTGLRYWAILTLGRYFTSAVMVQDDQRLIQHGPFRMLRHPGYTGVLLFGLGIGLAFANPLASLGFLLTQGAALIYRIQVEEAVLRQSFGETFDAYARRTWKLLPFVY